MVYKSVVLLTPNNASPKMGNLVCASCGILFGAPDHWEQARREDKREFFCPNGHRQLFAKSEADKLRQERDLLKQQIAQKDDEIKWQREKRQAEERRVSAARGQITKLKKRAKAGVCPCCNRTFTNMALHMKTKHPDMDPNVIDLGVEKAKRVS